MRRSPMGAWCAYVGIQKDHPWHGLGYSESVERPSGWTGDDTTIDEVGVINVFCSSLKGTERPEIALLVRCHGGLTYASDHPGGSKPDDRASWWFGFDCSHSGDLCPKHRAFDGDVYRDMPYVIAACEKAAADLAGVA